MPTYNDLRPKSEIDSLDYSLVFDRMDIKQKKRILENLLNLRAGLRANIPEKRADHNLLVATWNIKGLGLTKQRLSDAFIYIAEIISHLDLVAVQEVNDDLKHLHVIMELLGDPWSYVITDVTEGDAGASERSAYIFNKDRVQFAGLSGEIVLWDALTATYDVKQLNRTPHITGFRSGWKTFAIVNLHLQPGDSGAETEERRQEVELLLKALDEKISGSKMWNENLILVGDFNLYKSSAKDKKTVQSIKKAGFREVESLKGVMTTSSKKETYDRLFLTSNEYFTLGTDNLGHEKGGVFDPYQIVYKLEDAPMYKDDMEEVYDGRDLNVRANLDWYYKRYWRDNQMSDHFPVWIELIVDSADLFLQEKLNSYA